REVRILLYSGSHDQTLQTDSMTEGISRTGSDGDRMVRNRLQTRWGRMVLPGRSRPSDPARRWLSPGSIRKSRQIVLRKCSDCGTRSCADRAGPFQGPLTDVSFPVWPRFENFYNLGRSEKLDNKNCLRNLCRIFRDFCDLLTVGNSCKISSTR